MIERGERERRKREEKERETIAAQIGTPTIDYAPTGGRLGDHSNGDTSNNDDVNSNGCWNLRSSCLLSIVPCIVDFTASRSSIH